jgi:hypothetical protein
MTREPGDLPVDVGELNTHEAEGLGKEETC